MNTHKLGLEIVPTNNIDLLKIIDTSKYSNLVPVSCGNLVITAPGFDHASTHEVDKNFNITFSACDLELQKKDCETTFEPLPDGIYVIKYTVAPHSSLYVEYNHLRTTKVRNEIAQAYCNLDVNLCMTDKEKEKQILELQTLSAYLDAATANIELCHKTDKGWQIYEYVLKRLDKFTCKEC